MAFFQRWWWRQRPGCWTSLRVWTHLILVAAAAAKSLQSFPTLCDPTDGSPPGSPVPGILQARTLEWVAISFSNAWKWEVKVKLLSCVWLLATPWTAYYQALPSMGFSRQEYWSGLPLPSPDFYLAFTKIPNKAEHRRLGAFKLWCWRRLLRVPLSARRSNQSILKEINPEYSLEELVLKLKLQYFNYLMWRANSLEKTWILGKNEGRRRRGDRGSDGWMASPTQWAWIWANSRR